ncbi:MAG: arginase family protein [DPANN group archaeon]|nr:arginase family protein [DPANN group archaeon]
MISIIKIPFDKCIVEQARRGAALGPDAIHKELKDFFEFEEKFAKKTKFFEVKETSDFEKMHKEAESLAAGEYKKGNLVVGLGGDHSVSYGLMKAFANAHKKSGLIYLDAHLDCQDDFLPPTHEDILRAAVKEKLFAEIIVVGARNFTAKEKDFADKNKIQFNKEIDYKKIMNLCEKVENIYISIDIDAVDPAFAPGTGWPEPLGFMPQQVATLLEFLKATRKVKGFDIVEVSPPKDVNNITSRLAARFIIELLR